MIFFFSSRRRHTRYWRDWSSDVCSSDLVVAHRSSAFLNSGHAKFEWSVVHPMTPRNVPLQVMGSSTKAGSRYRDSDPAIGGRATGVAILRLRQPPPIRLGAVKSLTAPRRSRTLLRLREGLAQLLLLLLRQVGRDDLEVVLLELVDDLVGGRRPAGKGEEGRRSFRYLLTYLLYEVVVYADVRHRSRERSHPGTHRRAEEGHEEDQANQEPPESTT